MSTVLDFQVSVSPPSSAITVCGEVDMFTAPLLRARLHEQVCRSGPDLIVDLTEVGFLAAAGLNVLATAHNAALAAGLAFRVVAGTRPVLRPLQLTKLDGVLACYPDLDSARAASPAPRLAEPHRSVDEGHTGR